MGRELKILGFFSKRNCDFHDFSLEDNTAIQQASPFLSFYSPFSHKSFVSSRSLDENTGQSTQHTPHEGCDHSTRVLFAHVMHP